MKLHNLERASLLAMTANRLDAALKRIKKGYCTGEVVIEPSPDAHDRAVHRLDFGLEDLRGLLSARLEKVQAELKMLGVEE